MHDQPIHFRRQIDLAGKPTGPACAAGKVEHVFLILARGRQLVEPLLRDNHMAGRTGHLPFASAFQRLPRILANLEQVVAGHCLDRLRRFAIGADEMDFHAYCLSAAALIRDAARSISSTVV